MLKIGDFSKLSRISIRMLRHYDEIGLLAPAGTDPFTGYRYYTEAQLPVANRIAAMKEMGFSLAEAGMLLKSGDDLGTLERCLLLKQSELEVQASDTGRRLLLLETALKRLRKDGINMKYDVTLKEIPERKVASLRSVIPAYDQEGTLWEMLYRETAPLRMQMADPAMGLVVFHDCEHREADADVEIQVCVKGSYQNTEHVVFKTMPAVQIASATYQGSYNLLREVNAAVANWVRDNGYAFSAPSFCIYHVSPSETTNPDEYVTEVCYPVTKEAK